MKTIIVFILILFVFLPFKVSASRIGQEPPSRLLKEASFVIKAKLTAKKVTPLIIEGVVCTEDVEETFSPVATIKGSFFKSDVVTFKYKTLVNDQGPCLRQYFVTSPHEILKTGDTAVVFIIKKQKRGRTKYEATGTFSEKEYLNIISCGHYNCQ